MKKKETQQMPCNTTNIHEKKARESKHDECMKKKQRVIVYLYPGETIHLNYYKPVREIKITHS
jgi:hypothetical protein